MNIPKWLERREFNHQGLFEDGFDYRTSIEISLDSLRAYGDQYKHWVISYSGGKDSSATVTFVAWAIQSGQVKAPDTLTVMYADTLMELPPLAITARAFLADLQKSGIRVRIVELPLEKRWWVQILGRGMQPPTRGRRWCTRILKGDPMDQAVRDYSAETGEDHLTIIGVRQGESAVRDQRISVSCGKQGGECGQGWFYHSTAGAKLAPLVHWRVCHVWRWLYSADNPYPITLDIADVYAGEDVGMDGDMRTGCIRCEIAQEDTSFDMLVRKPRWAYLKPLEKLTPLYAEMRLARNRKRKIQPYLRADGKYGAKPGGSLGPLTMEARSYFFERVREIEVEANYKLISDDEERVIRQMWADNIWPDRWDGSEPNGDVPYDQIFAVGNELFSIERIV